MFLANDVIDGPLQEVALLVSSTIALRQVSKTKKAYSLNFIASRARLELGINFVCLFAFHIIPFPVDYESLKYVVGTFALRARFKDVIQHFSRPCAES